jgi:hypothetical protein
VAEARRQRWQPAHEAPWRSRIRYTQVVCGVLMVMTRRSIRTAADSIAAAVCCCDPEALAESFLSHLRARNKDSKPRPKTNQYCTEFTGLLTGKCSKADNRHWRIAGLIEEIDVVDADANQQNRTIDQPALGSGSAG